MEKMFYWTSKAHGLRYVSLRYFNACGADKSGKIGEVHNPESHLIPLILQVPNGKRESISIYGTDYDTPDGTCIRDYIHVSDLAQAHILAVKYLKNGNESNIFNLGNGVGYSVKEVIDKARKVTGHPIPAIETPKRAGDPARLVASSERQEKFLAGILYMIALKKLYLTHGIGIRIIQMVFEKRCYHDIQGNKRINPSCNRS